MHVLMLGSLTFVSLSAAHPTHTCFIVPDVSAIPASCPNHSGPCATLSQFVLSPTTYISLNSSGVDLVLLPGNHSLESILILEDYSEMLFFSMFGRKSSIGVTINSEGSGGIYLSQVSEVRIEHIKFVGFSSAKFEAIFDSLIVHNCSFTNGNGTALELEYNRYVTISSSEFISNVGTLREVSQTAFTNKFYSAGGALSVQGNDLDELHIKRCTFFNNSAEVGGVIYSFGDGRNVFDIRNSSFFDNVLLYSPVESSLYNDGTVLYCEFSSRCIIKIATSVFEGNVNVLGFALFAIRRSKIFIQYSYFAVNRGAIINAEDNSQVRVLNSKFGRNVNAHQCGGLFLVSSCSLVIRSCNFLENYAHQGGVVCAESSYVETSNCNFTRNYGNSSGGVYFLDYQSSLVTNKSLYDSNEAHEDGGVISAIRSSNVTAYNNTFVNNSALIGGGVFMCQEGSLLTLLKNIFLWNHANVSGGVLQTSCNLSIYNSTFNYNYAGIGGVIEATGSTLLIDTCNFTLNDAKDSGGVGALYIVSVTITQSMLVNNTAHVGGVLFMIGVENDSFINKTTFLLNEARDFGAAIYADGSRIKFYSVNLSKNSALLGVMYFQKCNFVYFKDTNFISNTGSLFTFNSKVIIEGVTNFSFSSNVQPTSDSPYQEGGAVTCIQSEVQFNLADIFFQENHAIQGGAMVLSETKLFIINTIIKIVDNNATFSGGGMYCFQSEITTEGHIWLTGNTAVVRGGAMHLIGTTINIPFSAFRTRAPPGTLRLFGNYAQEGGGIYFEGNAKLYISKYGPITSGINERRKSMFVNNSAKHGGAVFIADGTDSGTCSSMSSNSVQSTVSECTIQVLSLHDHVGDEFLIPQNFMFANNTASSSGSDLYGGLLDRCRASLYAEVRQRYRRSSKSETDFLGVAYLKNISNINKEMISSDPVKICFCINATQDCSHQHSAISAKKGERIVVELVAVDQMEHPVNATVRSYLPSEESGLGEGQLTQYVSNTCSEVMFEIFSPNDSEEVILYAEGPCKDIGISQRRVKVTFLPCTCPIGFKENDKLNTRCECICDEVISSLQAECDIASSSIIRHSNFWVTYLSNQGGYIVYPECPLDYCHPPTLPVSINLNLPHGADAQCKSNHMGNLCGACLPGYSTILGSSKCLPCSNNWIALIIAFFFAGVVLVVFILYFNLTVAVGTINGLLFYANIVMANHVIYIQDSNILSVFISWLNLDLGIEVCLYNGMDNYVKVWMRFLFPLYIIVLVILIIVVSERWVKFAKLLTYKNPVATLATLILLSYTQLLRTIISSFSFAILEYPDGSRKIAWLPDANVDYFSGKHAPLFLAAMLVVLIGLAYTIFLFSWQWLLRLTDRRFLRWIRNSRLNSFMDAYHAPYNFKYRFWTGLLLFVRVTLYLVASVVQNVFADPRVNLVFTTVLITGICVLRGYLKVSTLYKNWLIDIIELTFYFNIIFFTVATLYVRSSGKGNQDTVAIISIGITFAIFVSIVLYHIYAHCLVKLTVWRRVLKVTGQQTGMFRQLSNQDNAEYIGLDECLISKAQDKGWVPKATTTIIERFE